jgi:predicted pyridoxine 5'-phosphate oxidase superfamily flavin-nucleotide-binding protein
MKLDDELKKMIENNALAFATVNENGNPHCIAVGFAKVVSDEEILITNNYMIETEKNILKNPNVVLTVWNKEWEEKCFGYELTGIAEYFTEGKWYEMIKEIPENKGYPCKGAILIKISKVKKLV